MCAVCFTGFQAVPVAAAAARAWWVKRSFLGSDGDSASLDLEEDSDPEKVSAHAEASRPDEHLDTYAEMDAYAEMVEGFGDHEFSESSEVGVLV